MFDKLMRLPFIGFGIRASTLQVKKMLSKRAGTYLLISIIILFASISADAQALVSARILSSSGPVEIDRRSQGQAGLVKIEYSVNDELIAGDVIKTRKGGRLVLGLTDGSQAIISENTSVEITDLSQSPRTIFNMLRGKTRIKIEKAGGRPNPYRVNTPTAVIAVRGTLFDVFVTDKETQVFVHEGEVAVSNLTVTQAPVILTPGFRTRVQLSQPPESPTHFQPGRNNDTFNPRQNDKKPNGGFGHSGERGGERNSGGTFPGQPSNGPERTGPQPSSPPNSGRPPGARPREELFEDNDY